MDLKDLQVSIEYDAPDAAAATQMAEVLPSVRQHLSQWGAFPGPVTIRIQRSHAALEEAAGQSGLPWLRAWARFDTVDVESPLVWEEPATAAQVAELLSHEMTHCLMYQLVATSSDWTTKSIPLWFREGMASFTAEQGYRRPSDEELHNALGSLGAVDPLRDADDLYRDNSRLVYGAAHRGFEMLMARYGAARVLRLLSAMKEGKDFGPAFQETMGVEESEFTAEYRRYLLWRGWAGRTPSLPSPLLP